MSSGPKPKPQYTIVYTRDALDGLASVQPKNRRRIMREKIDKLVADPRPPGSRLLRNVDHEGRQVYRIRSGDYRALYGVPESGGEITVLDVGHRKNVYR